MTRLIKQLNLYWEQRLWHQGLNWVAGVDEVGRGSLAGPVVAAAVVFDQNHQPITGVNDSKLLSSKKRQELAQLIKKQALSWAIGTASVAIIDNLGIVAATMKAMRQALKQLPQVEFVLVDGPKKIENSRLTPNHQQAMIRGDQRCYSIAAASIVAKVYRDALMRRLAKNYPCYWWQQNKGYGTLKHRQAIATVGPSLWHRQKFVKKTLEKMTG